MKLLKMNHGNHVTIENLNDAKRAVRIFRDKESICFMNKDKSGAKDAIANWNHLFKVFPKETMADFPLEFSQINEEDHSEEMKINM